MARGRSRSGKEALLDARAATWAGLRTVVVDVETTGLDVGSSRVVSVALAEIQSGRVLGGYASLVDPGIDRIGASHIHHITSETLRAAAAPTFAVVGPLLLDRLRPRNGETVLLGGHNVVFDALMLNAELERTGQSLPAIGLLDTKVLAARAGVPATNLAELAEALGLTSGDAHTAVADAHTAADALLLLADRLREAEPGLHVEDLATVFDPRVRISRSTRIRAPRDDAPVLSAEHQAAHSQDITDPATRAASLEVCLANECVELVVRVEDAISTAADAEQVAEWCWQQLDRDDITRATQGRLLTALAVALGRTDDHELVQLYFRDLTKALAAYGPCEPDAQCDRCADPDGPRTCRFVSVRYKLLDAYLTNDGELDETRAEAFFPYKPPGPRRRPRPGGWFGRLVRAGDLDVAGFGAQLAAQAGARSRLPGWELDMLAAAWEAGSRNATLADQYSKRLLANPPADGSRSHLVAALDVCDQAIAGQGDVTGRVWTSLHERRDRIAARMVAPVRTPPATVRNNRRPRPSRYA